MEKTFLLVVKAKSAYKATEHCRERGLVPLSAKPIGRNFGQFTCRVMGDPGKITQWFADPTQCPEKDRSYPAGALLFYREYDARL